MSNVVRILWREGHVGETGASGQRKAEGKAVRRSQWSRNWIRSQAAWGRKKKAWAVVQRRIPEDMHLGAPVRESVSLRLQCEKKICFCDFFPFLVATLFTWHFIQKTKFKIIYEAKWRGGWSICMWHFLQDFRVSRCLQMRKKPAGEWGSPVCCEGPKCFFCFCVSFDNRVSGAFVFLLGDRSLLSLSGWESRRNTKKM